MEQENLMTLQNSSSFPETEKSQIHGIRGSLDLVESDRDDQSVVQEGNLPEKSFSEIIEPRLVLDSPKVETIALLEESSLAIIDPPSWKNELIPKIREPRLLNDSPWVRSPVPLEMKVQVSGWKFPVPIVETLPKPILNPKDSPDEEAVISDKELPDVSIPSNKIKTRIRPRPASDTVLFKDRLLYLLQPPLDHLFGDKQIAVPFKPFPYQLEGIAFLMPRHGALLADEMGLGKTAQAILSMRLLFHSGMISSALIICPKPLVFNWVREIQLWAPDLPFEFFQGDLEERRRTWFVSNCPMKIINYEMITRDAELLSDPRIGVDLVVLDEAQRIKNRTSKTAQIVCSLKRSRSWAITGTPIENRPEDLINLFAFIDPGKVPEGTPLKQIGTLTKDHILRRTKEMVQNDMPPKLIHDIPIELSPDQKISYELAEKEGVIRLNALGDTITVQHVFQLVMRLKQICNFDPVTGASSKLEQLVADMEEVSENQRKAIVFSQWVEPLEMIDKALKPFGPLQFHGKIPQLERIKILDQFKSDPSKHVILMSYGTGSVGLNLQFCDYVFLFDRWWNPAIEDQAINRAHRIGQKNPVTVIRFVVHNSIEQRIANILEAKRKLFQEVLEQAGSPASIGLSENEIFSLFDIQARPHKIAA